MNFNELFVSYENALVFYSFLKMTSKQIIRYDQERIELMFDLNEIFSNKRLTIGKKHCEFLIFTTFHKKSLDDLLDFYLFFYRDHK